MKEDQIVRVLWMDSAGNSGNWYDPHELSDYIQHHRTPPLVATVGYLHFQDPQVVVVSQSKHGDMTHGVVAIPAGAVKDIEELKVVEA